MSTSIGRGPSVFFIDRHAHPSSRAVQTVSAVAAIVHHAPGCDTLRVTAACLQKAADHASQACSGYTPARQHIPCFSDLLTNTKFVIPKVQSSPITLPLGNPVRLFLVPASVFSSSAAWPVRLGAHRSTNNTSGKTLQPSVQVLNRPLQASLCVLATHCPLARSGRSVVRSARCSVVCSSHDCLLVSLGLRSLHQ